MQNIQEFCSNCHAIVQIKVISGRAGLQLTSRPTSKHLLKYFLWQFNARRKFRRNFHQFQSTQTINMQNVYFATNKLVSSFTSIHEFSKITQWRLISIKCCLGIRVTEQQLHCKSAFQSEERRQWLLLLPRLLPSLALCSTSFVRRRWLITAGMIGNWPLENNLLRGLPPSHTPLPQPPSSTLPPPLTIICLICASLKTRRLILMNRCAASLYDSPPPSMLTAHSYNFKQRFKKKYF